MKTVLISPYPDITSIGIRAISSYLKKSGQETRVIFLPVDFLPRRFAGNSVNLYDDDTIAEIVDISRDAGLIGISVTTGTFPMAREITQALKKDLKIPIAWGGIHPTLLPDECLEFADIVCIGEGEESLLELTENIESGADYFNPFFYTLERIIFPVIASFQIERFFYD